ncbi:MAG TPA: hypothetical protein VLA61_19190 [Ideonella sp.]|uniref:alpha/beta hydrolase n=1 Tax=Ideonella sp. TaxID=1929293 RepID=UPI002C62298C|nr:hypothetical protein [Ideonella sp.]HSI50403.1 hypothetical protein [Ideonella sp.]
MPALSALRYTQPFTVAVAPWGPARLLTVEVSAGPEDEAPALRVRCLADGESRELMALPTIRPLWLRCGQQRFAVVSASEVQLFDAHGPVARLPLGGVSAAEFADDDALWLLQGQRLYRAAADTPGQPLAVASGVAAFTLGAEGAAWIERDEAGLADLVRFDGRNQQRLPLGSVPGQRLSLCLSAGLAWVMAQPAFHTGRQGAVIHRHALADPRALTPLALPALRHAGLRKLPLVGWGEAGVLTLAEPGDEMAVCLLPADGGPLQRLTPAGDEVLDFDADAAHDTLACLSQATAAPGQARRLKLWRGLLAGAPRLSQHDGVAPAFGLQGGNLGFVQATGAGFQACVDGQDHAQAQVQVLDRWARHALPALPVWSAAPQGGWRCRGQATPGRPLVVVLPGLHKIVTPELQTNFLQDFLTRSVADLAQQQGFDVGLLQVPGSAGAGKAYREAAGLDDLAALASQTAAALEALADAAGGPLGVVSASLGTLGLLQALGCTEAVAACALVAPVYTPAVLDGAPAHQADFPTHWPTGRCELLLLHGERDEVTPHAHSAAFVRGPAEARRRLFTLPGEGHIFAHPAAWQRAAAELCSFFTATLQARQTT